MRDMSTVPAPRVASEDVDATISRTVRAIIAYHHVNVRKLAPAMGLSRTAFYNRLSGHTQWSAAEVKRAADALGVSVATLYDGLSVAGAGFEPATSGSRAHLTLVPDLDELTQDDVELVA
jgi:hypothetical protein